MSELEYDPFDIVTEAIDTGDIKVLQPLRDLILNGRVDVNEWCDEATLLGMVAEAGDFELVRLMLELGSDVNLPTKSDASTALMNAAIGGNLNIIQLLIEAGANVNEIRGGDTALTYAVRSGHEEVIQFLSPLTEATLRNKVLREQRPKKQKSISRVAVELFEAITDFNLEKVQELITLGVDVNATDEYGRTAIAYAANLANFDIVKALLDAGANPNEAGVGSPALIVAAGFGDPDAVDRLIEAGADINTVLDGRTPLMQTIEWAFSPNDERIVRLLIEAGVNLEATDKYGNTALMIAVYQDKSNIAEMLVKAGASTVKMNSAYLLNASRNSSVEQVQELLEAGVDVNIRGTNGFTALACAADAGYQEVVRLLIQADADMEASDEMGITPLMIAIGKARIPVIHELLKAGANVHCVDKAGQNAIDRAYNAAMQKATRQKILGILKEYRSLEKPI